MREIAAVPGLTVLTVGAGTLGGVFSSTGADGQRVRDQAGFDAGVASRARGVQGVQGRVQLPGQQSGGDRDADGAGLQRLHDAGATRLGSTPSPRDDGCRAARCRRQNESAKSPASHGADGRLLDRHVAQQ